VENLGHAGRFFILTASHSGKVADVSAASGDNGTPIIQWDYTGNSNQQWLLDPARNRRYWGQPAARLDS
jgi:hypothetical protein